MIPIYAVACRSMAVLLLAVASPQPILDIEAYWGEIEAKETLVDVTEHETQEDADLTKVLESHMNESTGDLRYYPVAPDEPLLPKRFHIGDAFTVITEKGTTNLKLLGFGIQSGASVVHFFLRLEGSSTLAGQALVLRQRPLPATFALRKAATKPLEPPAALKAQWKRQIQAEASKKAAKQIARLTLSAPNLICHAGKFGGSATWLCAVTVAQGEVFDGYLSSLFFSDAKGHITDFVVPPQIELDRYEPQYFIDLDQDGVDEIILDSSYYEGSSTELLRWNGKKHQATVLSGDGA